MPPPLLRLLQCYCFVCDVPASECAHWGDGEPSKLYQHCNASAGGKVGLMIWEDIRRTDAARGGSTSSRQAPDGMEGAAGGAPGPAPAKSAERRYPSVAAFLRQYKGHGSQGEEEQPDEKLPLAGGGGASLEAARRAILMPHVTEVRSDNPSWPSPSSYLACTRLQADALAAG